MLVTGIGVLLLLANLYVKVPIRQMFFSPLLSVLIGLFCSFILSYYLRESRPIISLLLKSLIFMFSYVFSLLVLDDISLRELIVSTKRYLLI